ncbi:type VI secretion system lipoprotein TssJ [Lelliottia wanjuensis]|uniref:Type VI secretion system lipoprotein TssJ n=1 Tax=Lelliottia wanjuensis TaxID=3050585 RepID=A0AAP4D3V1_9ENTR|nr:MULTISPECIES: type VI secretion system lipoprotein TssJ [unclassified Lelliottia]MDK9362927.1 type VI secretion system lipoprotein TssJ [Lelliottia sp. V106_12]MDK9616588.1 type VI secretion system lipoprotein TssJ [Lelliottia sp. V106_9]
MNIRPSRYLWLCLPLLLLSSCGLYQKTKQGTQSVAKAIFYRQVETLHLSFAARSAINADDAQQAMPLRIRVLQLNDRKTFDNTEYTDLLTQPDLVLKESLLTQRQLSVYPGQTVNLDIPMDEKAQFVAVVGLFRKPDRTRGTWKQVLSRDSLDPDEPRVIEVRDNTLLLKPVKE